MQNNQFSADLTGNWKLGVKVSGLAGLGWGVDWMALAGGAMDGRGRQDR